MHGVRGVFFFYVFFLVFVLAFELHAFVHTLGFCHLSVVQTATESIDYHLKAFSLSSKH